MKKWVIPGIIIILILIGAAILLRNPNPIQSSAKEELIIFAASSLSDVMEELAKEFKVGHPKADLLFNLGSSGTLQIQIEQGAPADIFASAGSKQMDTLIKKDHMVTDTVTNFATNRLVVIAPLNSKLTIREPEDMLDPKIKQIAIGDPSSVPVGQYSAEAMKNTEIWNQLQGKLIYGTNVRQVLQYVERGEVEVGFVYASDALISKKVEVIWVVPEEAHRRIEYPMGIVREGKNQALAREFMTFVSSSEGQAILQKYGFVPVK